MKAIGYIRVSTVDQADNGNGLEIQERAIARLCNERGLTLAATYRDAGISGTTDLDQRYGLAAALTALEAERRTILIVHRLDRLARDLILQELLLNRISKSGSTVLSVTEPDVDSASTDPTKTLIRQILGALAQYERALIRARMEAGRASKLANGGYVGGAPSYGFAAAGGELVTNFAEGAVVAMVRELRSQGRTYREICRELEAAGLKPRRGQCWHPAVVRDIAQRGVATTRPAC